MFDKGHYNTPPLKVGARPRSKTISFVTTAVIMKLISLDLVGRSLSSKGCNNKNQAA